ncbi:MAG: glycosyltransferase [Pseudomonadota bacterium]
MVAVVVTHNRISELRTTLDSLMVSLPHYLSAIVVFDNASKDGTEEYLAALKAENPLTDVIRSEKNLGGAGGFELGMRHAVSAYDPDWIVVMDDDGRPEPDALAVFHSQDRSIAHGWGAATYHPDGRICEMNRPSINPFWDRSAMLRSLSGRGRAGFHINSACYDGDAYVPVDGVSFVGFFISRSGIERAGYPDGDLFIYGDDVLYTLGLRSKGGTSLFDPNIRFEHNYSTNSVSDQRFRPLWKTYYHYRNLLMVYRLCSGWWFGLVFPIVAAKWFFKVRFHSGQRLHFLKLLCLAIWHALISRTSVSHDTVLKW